MIYGIAIISKALNLHYVNISNGSRTYSSVSDELIYFILPELVDRVNHPTNLGKPRYGEDTIF